MRYKVRVVFIAFLLLSSIVVLAVSRQLPNNPETHRGPAEQIYLRSIPVEDAKAEPREVVIHWEELGGLAAAISLIWGALTKFMVLPAIDKKLMSFQASADKKYANSEILVAHIKQDEERQAGIEHNLDRIWEAVQK